jgi:Flp pilus assembly protein TadB
VSAPAAGLRIGDAERAVAADRLAWHFSHGRLDQAELDERLAQAMRATTASDLSPLFADLPADEPVPATGSGGLPRLAAGRPRPARAPRRSRLASLVLAVCIVVGVAVVLHPLTHSIAALAVIGLLAVLWLRRRHSRD